MIIKLFHSRFQKRFKKLPLQMKVVFWDRLRLFEVNQFNPILNNHKLRGDQIGRRSINISSNLRAIFEIEGEKIFFVDIGTHSELYGK